MRPGGDRDQVAVGEAEARAFGGTGLDRRRRPAELAVAAAGVTGGGWWAEAGGPPVTVRAARSSARSSRARSHAGVVEIGLATDQHDLATLIHELAHALAGLGHGHDAVFRAAAVDVTVLVAGSDPAAQLAEALTQLGAPAGTRRWPPPWRYEGVGFRAGVGAPETGGTSA